MIGWWEVKCLMNFDIKKRNAFHSSPIKVLSSGLVNLLPFPVYWEFVCVWITICDKIYRVQFAKGKTFNFFVFLVTHLLFSNDVSEFDLGIGIRWNPNK